MNNTNIVILGLSLLALGGVVYAVMRAREQGRKESYVEYYEKYLKYIPIKCRKICDDRYMKNSREHRMCMKRCTSDHLI